MFKASALPRLLLPYIHDRKDKYGCNESHGLRTPPDAGPKKVVVEFSSPNIEADFQSKHLRSTIIGAYVSKIYEAMGWDVTRITYLGDWGKQIALLGAGWERFGSEELFQQDPVGHMLDVYAKIEELFKPELEASKKARDSGADTTEIESKGLYLERDEFFKKLEGGNEEAVALWKRFREASIEHLTSLYARLNVKFDEYSGESQVSAETMAEVEDILKSKGICEESKGSWIVDFKKHGGRHGVSIIRGRNGSSTYFLRDLGAVLERWRKYSFDKMIYVVVSGHDMHFQRLFKTLELMGMPELAGKLQHLPFKEEKVSQVVETSGQGHMLEKVLDESELAMAESLKANPEKAALLGEDAASSVGLAALLAQELATKRASNHALDIESMTSFESGTGPDIQYWYARLRLMLKQGLAPPPSDLSDADLSALEGDERVDLLRLLAQFPEVASSSYASLESSTVVSYLVNVTRQLSYCLEDEIDLGAAPGVAALFESTRQVLENGMRIIGIEPAPTS